MATLRSSTRATPRRKYTVDAFEGIAELQSDNSSDDGEGTQQLLGTDEEDADEFQGGHDLSEADHDSMSGLDESGAAEEDDTFASDAGERDFDDSISIAEDPDHPQKPRSKHRTRVPRLNAQGEQISVRGIDDDLSNSMKSSRRLLYLYGPSEEEFEPVYQAYVKWNQEPSLPSRQIDAEGFGGFAYNKAFKKEIEDAESNWSWYAKSGDEAFQQRQVLKLLDVSEVGKYLRVDGTGERSFVMGALSSQRFFRTQVRQFITLSSPFQPAPRGNGATKTPSENYKSGFLINLGARVNCLDWAPNQCGRKQYLAVSLLPQSDTDMCASAANSFTAQPASKTSVQIWELSATDHNYIDKTEQPRLSIVVCMERGFIKEMKWCPVPSKHLDKFGLLGCVTADGALQVVDVAMPNSDTETTNVLVEKPLFASKPPNTICTSLAWLSSSRIAAACANGFVAVWDLSKQTDAANPRPEQFLGISTSYISCIISGYPSFPNILMTNSITGHLTLTDLSRPKPATPSGTALSPRSRLSQLLVVWHDFAHAAVSCEDNLVIRGHPVRRWFGVIGTNRLKSHATSMAVSPCHPHVLIGTAGGEVVAHNPMGRIVHGNKVELLLQPWFLHEWRRPNEDETKAAGNAVYSRNTGTSERDIVNSVIGKNGLSRIADDFKAYHTTLTVKDGTTPNFRNGVQFNTIHEEKTAITSIAWNPNLHVGGWAAAGMADGLLRLEDLAI